MREIELYAPVRDYLAGQGYDVKAEIGAADVVACREDEPPVIVELKTGFSLSLFHQAVARQAVTDAVYVAVPRGTSRAFQRSLKDNLALARRLGLGVILVRLRDAHVEVLCDPGPYKPRISTRRKTRLLREFARRVGDPNTGGATRVGLVTAYRQDALRCAAHLAQGAARGADVKAAHGIENATRIMADDHYGWFERVDRGVYALTPKGRDALKTYADALETLA